MSAIMTVTTTQCLFTQSNSYLKKTQRSSPAFITRRLILHTFWKFMQLKPVICISHDFLSRFYDKWIGCIPCNGQLVLWSVAYGSPTPWGFRFVAAFNSFCVGHLPFVVPTESWQNAAVVEIVLIYDATVGIELLFYTQHWITAKSLSKILTLFYVGCCSRSQRFWHDRCSGKALKENIW